MIRILQSGWAAFIGGVLAFVITAAAALNLRPAAPMEVQAPDPQAGPSWEFHNPELDMFISELNREREELAAKKTELAALETRLQAERAELRKVMKSTETLRREIDSMITRVHEEETANLKKLARVYASMSPEGAVAVFKELEDPAVVKLMGFMREAETAPILELLALSGEVQARRVAAISERLRLMLNDSRRTQAP
jgi:flagellar motility protein MotE (MotC chaperone)